MPTSPGGGLLLEALAGLGFAAESAASEGALVDAGVTVPVSEPLDFWYPLTPTSLLQDGRMAKAAEQAQGQE